MRVDTAYRLFSQPRGGLPPPAWSLPLLLVRSVSKRIQNALLGFAAGVMLAASFFSLILPALETGAGPGWSVLEFCWGRPVCGGWTC